MTLATVAVVVLLMIITVAMHTWLATATVAADCALAADLRSTGRLTGMSLADREPPRSRRPRPTGGTAPSGNVLLIGYDTGPGRVDENTDTLLVVSIDPVSAPRR